MIYIKSPKEIVPRVHLLNLCAFFPADSSSTFAIGVSPAYTTYTGVFSEYSPAFFLYDTVPSFNLSVKYEPYLK